MRVRFYMDSTTETPPSGGRRICSSRFCRLKAAFRLPLEPAAGVAAFTMIELILVMAIVVVAVSITAPKMANFFRGRTLDSEARRLLALTHSGQSRAISEGIPTRLQFDIPNHTYRLQQDPGWSERDPKALEFSCDQDLQIEVVQANNPRRVASRNRLPDAMQSKANPQNLPEIRFLPDGSIDDTSPRALHLQDKNGVSLW